MIDSAEKIVEFLPSITDAALQIADFLINLLGLFAASVFAMGVMAAVALSFVWLIWRVRHRRVGACAGRMASSLSLTFAPAPHPHMQVWQGLTLEHPIWLATCAMCHGPIGVLPDPGGPVFFDGAPRLSFARYNALLMVVRLCDPMPDPFTLCTMRSAEATQDTGDARFDLRFKLSCARSVAVRRAFSSAPLRDALLGIYGPDRDHPETGIMVAANKRGLVVYWGTPRDRRAVEFGRSVAHAAERLSARRDFR